MLALVLVLAVLVLVAFLVAFVGGLAMGSTVIMGAGFAVMAFALASMIVVCAIAEGR